MPEIKLSDGKKIPFSKKIDGFEIAKKISKSLARDLLILFAISKPSIFFENAIFLPSDNFISGIYQDNTINFLYSLKVVWHILSTSNLFNTFFLPSKPMYFSEP